MKEIERAIENPRITFLLMNIHNFEDLIETKILARGFNYHEYGQVSIIESVGEGEFSAIVEGSNRYTVFVSFNQNYDITDHVCDCPYDWGPYCKHLAAVLYHLKDNEQYKKTSSEGSSVDTIKEELKLYRKQELLDMILHIAKRNSSFRGMISDYLGFENSWDE